MRLSGKVAIVTGGGRGIGRAACLRFAAEGARVIVADWNTGNGQEVERLVRDAGGEATFVRTDVSKVADVQAMVAAAVSTYGGLHVIYNNAAIVKGYGGPVEADVDDWDATMAVNVRGTYLCCKYAIPAIAACGGGSVINQSSVAAIQGGGPPLSGPCAAYTTSKSAIIGLTNSIAYSYGHQGVRANSILPGLIETGMTASLLESEEFRQAMIDSTPLRRTGLPDDVATVAAFLASDESSFVSGAAIVVDGACWLSQGVTYPQPLLFEDASAAD
jgi:NAD(P)-dependent dehydrogenase (short-subunit alcohol dehydrogenase family)